MKSSPKSKIIILFTLGILFAFSLIITTKLSFISENNNTDNENLNLSKLSEKIHINGNSGWSNAKTAGICTGNGTYSEPYVIEDLVIDGGGSGSCILIENSDVYFKIENCTVFNSGSTWSDAGIKLYNADNSQLINNNCSSNMHGVFLIMYCVNNTILENTISNNTHYGIYLHGNNNTILGNTINNYNSIGIEIELSNNNNILENNVNNNYNGIWVLECNNTMVSGNIVNNNSYNGIYLYYCHNIMVSGNIINNNNYRGINLDHTEESSIFLNCFTNNFLNTYVDDGINNQWDNGIKGNFWDDYTGLDEDGDGIGDTPYNIIGGGQDNFPLMKCPIHSQEGGGIPIELIILISVISGGAVIGVATLLLIIPKRKRIQ